MSVRLGPPQVTFRRDRFGECWHLIPDGELGPRTRALCGQPRQGTPLSETYAETRPEDPECLCDVCSMEYTRLSVNEAPGVVAEPGSESMGIVVERALDDAAPTNLPLRTR